MYFFLILNKVQLFVAHPVTLTSLQNAQHSSRERSKDTYIHDVYSVTMQVTLIEGV